MSDVLKEKKYFDPMYCGSDNFYKHPYGIIYTDSIRDFCEEHKAYWILDIVGSYNYIFKKYNYLFLTFDVENNACFFSAKEDPALDPVITQDIEYTDLDVSIKLYFANKTLCFPSDR